MKKLEYLLVLLASVTLAGCDYVASKEYRKERADRTYQLAMDEYRAGRLQLATEGLRKVCAADPANGSARFQLACLLQDSEKDFLGATSAYLEFLLQHPDGEKAQLARQRLKDCERNLAESLADRYGLNEAKAARDRIAVLEKELSEQKAINAKLTGDLTAALRKAEALAGENDRIRTFVTKDNGEDSQLSEKFKDAKLDVEKVRALDDRLVDPSESASRPARVKSEVATAKSLLDDEDATLGTNLLPPQPADAKAKRDALKKANEAAKAKAAAEAAARKAAIPDTYVVQEGDTLYKIAVRFYGTYTAWEKIREANKTQVSTDGRVRTGQRLVMPK